jgi:hypothetical protein
MKCVGWFVRSLASLGVWPTFQFKSRDSSGSALYFENATSEDNQSEEINAPIADESSAGATINPSDDESEFIYDEELQRLICVGVHYSEIPHGIIETYAAKTKVNRIEKSMFLFIFVADLRFEQESISFIGLSS